MAGGKSTIIYTLTDEAPLLATYSLLPIIETFTKPAGVEIVKSDITVNVHVLYGFTEYVFEELNAGRKQPDLGRLTPYHDTITFKFPNVCTFFCQITVSIKALQSKGYALPD